MVARITLDQLLTRYCSSPPPRDESGLVILSITRPEDRLPLRVVPL